MKKVINTCLIIMILSAVLLVIAIALSSKTVLISAITIFIGAFMAALIFAVYQDSKPIQ